MPAICRRIGKRRNVSADITRLITLNITALTRRANAVAPSLAGAGAGTIVNIASGTLSRPIVCLSHRVSERRVDTRCDNIAPSHVRRRYNASGESARSGRISRRRCCASVRATRPQQSAGL
ncbi:hypothetical protein CIG58_09370 [Klebsiella oxytoca]|nr:hypothetical protein CIG58_09370 [Klebsiella oxytoca]